MQPIAVFTRIKPLAADRTGGSTTAAAKVISSWDSTEGVVEMGGGTMFDHMQKVIPPDATQLQVYQTIAQPLVRQWLDGFDVDLISYGQTGSGKTFTMFGPPFSMETAAKSLPRRGVAGSDVLKEEHGFILRSGLEALVGVDAIRARGAQAVLHGSMVEMSISSLSDQTTTDLLNNRQLTYVDKEHHLQGALLVPLETAADVVRMAAAVETRLVRGTKMNDTSSRSHCCALYTLTVLEGDDVRTSRLQFFDLMGSERFTGGNSAHDTGTSSKSTMGGWEGIFANLSLSGLLAAVEAAAVARGSSSKQKYHNPMLEFVLTSLLAGSLQGHALTGMITCVSTAARNGDETYNTLKYGAGMAKLVNVPKRQPKESLKKLLGNARKQYAISAAVVAKGVKGKYQALRQAEVSQWEQTMRLLEALSASRPEGVRCDGADESRGKDEVVF